VTEVVPLVEQPARLAGGAQRVLVATERVKVAGQPAPGLGRPGCEPGGPLEQRERRALRAGLLEQAGLEQQRRDVVRVVGEQPVEGRERGLPLAAGDEQPRPGETLRPLPAQRGTRTRG
jgi:hypothetical protein